MQHGHPRVTLVSPRVAYVLRRSFYACLGRCEPGRVRSVPSRDVGDVRLEGGYMKPGPEGSEGAGTLQQKHPEHIPAGTNDVVCAMWIKDKHGLSHPIIKPM